LIGLRAGKMLMSRASAAYRHASDNDDSRMFHTRDFIACQRSATESRPA
jgi:hypothetical protein